MNETIERINLGLRIGHYVVRFVALVQKIIYSKRRKKTDSELREMQLKVDAIAQRTLPNNDKLAAALLCVPVLLILRAAYRGVRM